MNDLGIKEREDVILHLCHASLPSPHSSPFDTYLDFYTATLTNASKLKCLNIEKIALQSNNDVFRSADLLRQSPSIKRGEFESCAFGECSKLEQEHACRASVKVSFMIDCSSKDDYSEGFKLSDEFPVRWKKDQSFSDFLQEIFPMSLEPCKSTKVMKAWKLKKRYGFRFVPTNDLVQHLMYDPGTRTVKIFRHISWLKSHIRHSSNLALTTGFETSANHGTLHPRLLFETLLSIYYVLLPISVDAKSAKLARSLVRHSGFDKNLIVDDGPIREIPDDFEYIFWGRRLELIRSLVSNPPPANKLTAWMERHTSERNALTVAIVGLFLAALFGFLSFAVGVAQLIVSIYAWKYPVCT